MRKDEAKTHLSQAFNIWGFVPPHMLFGSACFGFQNAREQKSQEERRRDEIIAHQMLALRPIPVF